MINCQWLPGEHYGGHSAMRDVWCLSQTKEWRRTTGLHMETHPSSSNILHIQPHFSHLPNKGALLESDSTFPLNYILLLLSSFLPLFSCLVYSPWCSPSTRSNHKPSFSAAHTDTPWVATDHTIWHLTTVLLFPCAISFVLIFSHQLGKVSWVEQWKLKGFQQLTLETKVNSEFSFNF